MLEKIVYPSWAYSENSKEKAQINKEIYKEIKDMAKVKYVNSGYGHTEFEVIENTNNLSTDQLALICDGGNLCFGYRVEGRFISVYTD